MLCLRCSGLLVIEWLDFEPVQKCLCCGARIYRPIPEMPERMKCFYCASQPAPGLVSCLICTEKMKQYRAAHPKKRRIGPTLPVGP